MSFGDWLGNSSGIMIAVVVLIVFFLFPLLKKIMDSQQGGQPTQ